MAWWQWLLPRSRARVETHLDRELEDHLLRLIEEGAAVG